MAYLTYAEYLQLGGTLNETAFNRTERRARTTVDYYTQQRIQRLSEIPANIKELMADLIDLYAKGDRGIVQSVSNDGVSVSYRTDSHDIGQQAMQLVMMHAGEYAWRGVDCG